MHFSESHYRRWEIDDMTLPEMALALDDDPKPRPPGGRPNMTPDEVVEYWKKLERMTPRQRLEATRHGEV